MTRPSPAFVALFGGAVLVVSLAELARVVAFLVVCAIRGCGAGQ